MSAETLRRAAALMRERAKAATSGPWTLEYRNVRGSQQDPRRIFYGSHSSPPMILQGSLHRNLSEGEKLANATHVVSWHPNVALAVSDLLMLESECDVDTCVTYQLAIVVARVYLGDQS